MKKMKKIAIVVCVVSACCLFSCTDEKDSLSLSNNTSVVKSTESEIPYYANWNVFNTELLNRLSEVSKGLDFITLYEENHGYRSIGRVADEIYLSVISDNSIQTLEELQDRVQQYAEYITQSYDGSDDYCVPVYSHNIHRYMANEGGLFQVSNYVTRLFESGNVTTISDSINVLLSLTESDLDNLDSTVFYYGSMDDTVLISDEMEMPANKSNPPIDYELYTGSYYLFNDVAVPHTTHTYVAKEKNSKRNDPYKVDLTIRNSVSLVTPILGWSVTPYVECKSYKRFLGFGPYVLQNTQMSGNIKLLTCVGKDVIKTSYNINTSASELTIPILNAEIDALFVSKKKYVHFRGSNSSISTSNVNNVSIVFGDQTSL